MSVGCVSIEASIRSIDRADVASRSQERWVDLRLNSEFAQKCKNDVTTFCRASAIQRGPCS